MKKLKRSERLVDMTQYLLSKPHTLIPLTTFAERYGAAKSSISEDLAIIKDVFESEGLGASDPGRRGGVRYIPKLRIDHALRFAESCASSFSNRIGFCRADICTCLICSDNLR